MSGSTGLNPIAPAGPPADPNDEHPNQITKPEETMTKAHYELPPQAVPHRAGFSHEHDLKYSDDKRHVTGPRQMPADPYAAGLHLGTLNGGNASDPALPPPPAPPYSGDGIAQFNADPASAGPDATYVRATSPETSRPF